MTAREARLVRAAEQVFAALERVARWGGTGGTRQAQAWEARDRAVEKWERLVAEVNATSGEQTP